MLILTSSCIAGFLRQWHVQGTCQRFRWKSLWRFSSSRMKSQTAKGLAWVNSGCNMWHLWIVCSSFCQMGRYCSCSGAAACPVTTPLEMRKNSWIPSPQMFQKLTWPKPRRHLGHVVRFVRFIPATTATISSMEPFVCKTEKIHRDVGAVRAPWRFRWAITGGLMVENTGARPIQSLRNFIWFEEKFFEMVFFVRMPMIYWSWMIMFVFFF